MEAAVNNDKQKDRRRPGREGLSPLACTVFALVTVFTFVLCICLGSVNIPAGKIFSTFASAVSGSASADQTEYAILLTVRLPRVLCVALTGASLALSGAAMQGLLRNPLADGSTLGVSSGASLGAVIAMAFGAIVPGLPASGTMIMAMLSAFLSMMIIIVLAYKIDYSLSTNTIILIGIIYSMFMNSIISLILTMVPDKIKNITFWTMGSLAGSSMKNAAVLAAALLVCGTVILRYADELNAFSIDETNAANIGVSVKKVRLVILIMVSVLIGICVSTGGTIAFVGLVTPHIVRIITGPNHRKLLPAVLFTGAVFLMLADLLARMIFRPRELPIGVITSFVGAVVFVFIFYRSRSRRA